MFRIAFKPARREQRMSIRAAYCADQHTSEKWARVNCRGSRMGSDALWSGNIDGPLAVAMVADGGRGAASTSRCQRRSGSLLPALGFPLFSNFRERYARCDADVKAPSCRAVLAIARPAHKTAHQVSFVEPVHVSRFTHRSGSTTYFKQPPACDGL
jgi:hypothetical protein